jgi:hypothetical protein
MDVRGALIFSELKGLWICLRGGGRWVAAKSARKKDRNPRGAVIKFF